MKILLHAHPFAATPPQVFETDSLGEWLLARYGASPSVGVQLFRGQPCAETEITGDVPAILACDAAEYTVLESPGEPGSTAALIYSYFQIAMVVVSVAMMLLAPSPKMPQNVNRGQESPNNALTNRQNQVRLMQRVEDIYGTVKAIPSLMMPTYTKWINNKEHEYGYYCVSRGYNDLTEIRDGDTLLSDITGAAASVYWPFTSPNSGDGPVLQIGDAIIDAVLTVERVIAADGITLMALNQLQFQASGGYTFTPDAGGGKITQTSDMTAYQTTGVLGSVVPEQTVTVTMAPISVVVSPAIASVDAAAKKFSFDGAEAFPAGISFTSAGFVDGGNNGSFVVATSAPGEITVTAGSLVDGASAGATFTGPALDYSGTYEVLSITLPYTLVLTPASTAGWSMQLFGAAASVQIDDVTEFTDWITLADAERTEVWCNVVAQGGMFIDAGSGHGVTSVDYAIEIEQLDAVTLAPLGVVETVTGTLTGATSQIVADTVERATAWTGPARARMRRTSAYPFGFAGSVVDEIKWQDLYSVSPVAKTEFGNKTTIHTITQATPRATAVKARELNCIDSRLLPTYNGTAFSGAFDADGLLASGSIHPTSKLVDIIAAVSIDPKIGNRDLATEVDMAQIWGVQQRLDAWNTECGQFNYTLDSDNTSYEETLIMIANAGFAIAYRQNGKIRLALDYAQSASTALFTHRNKKPKSETLTRTFANDAECDGVEFKYHDRDTHNPETIILPADLSYTKLKPFEIPGITSFKQAWFRANREYFKLIGQRVSIETTTTPDARSLLPNARVDIVDNTRFKSYDGEVVGQSGLTLTLSRDVAFVPATAHSIVLMKRDGSLQSLTATAGPAANQVVLAGAPAEAIVTTPGADGIRTIFSFAADSGRGALAYLVQEIDLAADPLYATVRGINYSAAYFQADLAEIPAKDTIIN